MSFGLRAEGQGDVLARKRVKDELCSTPVFDALDREVLGLDSDCRGNRCTALSDFSDPSHVHVAFVDSAPDAIPLIVKGDNARLRLRVAFADRVDVRLSRFWILERLDVA